MPKEKIDTTEENSPFVILVVSKTAINRLTSEIFNYMFILKYIIRLGYI